mmetsp:Transcript_1546/g.3312  ORF Transcript_1546/g.3312 Transcript_1546/m.3312 type:complete len:92 (+) Transcript_1546:534-809(+)
MIETNRRRNQHHHPKQDRGAVDDTLRVQVMDVGDGVMDVGIGMVMDGVAEIDTVAVARIVDDLRIQRGVVRTGWYMTVANGIHVEKQRGAS